MRGCGRGPRSARARASAISSRPRPRRWRRASRSIISPTSATPIVGANSNIGAGTITCNYDGFAKHRTEIGEGAFVGTNSSLVAPVKIGNGAYVGSGSVITKDVPDDALAVERSPQTNREGGAKRYREMKTGARRRKARLTAGIC